MKTALDIWKKIIHIQKAIYSWENKYWEQEIEKYELDEKVRELTDRQITILSDWKEDICKKQRDICADEIEEEADSSLGIIISAIKNIVRNAPEPT